MADFLHRRNKIIRMIRDMEDMLKIIHELALFEKDVYKAGEVSGRAIERQSR